MPERGEPAEIGLGGSKLDPAGVGRRRRLAQAFIDRRQAAVAQHLAVRLVLGALARLLLPGELGREAGELGVAGLPQGAQLEKNEGTEAGGGIGQQIAERVELLLDADRRALLLFEAVAQQMELVLQVGIGLLQARTILKELHQPLFFRTRAARFGAHLEKTQLVDQCPAPG